MKLPIPSNYSIYSNILISLLMLDDVGLGVLCCCRGCKHGTTVMATFLQGLWSQTMNQNKNCSAISLSYTLAVTPTLPCYTLPLRLVHSGLLHSEQTPS